MTRTSERIPLASICALVGGLALATSAGAGPLGGAALGAGGYGYGAIGAGHGIAAGGMAGAYGQFDSRAARPTHVTQRVGSDVNGAVQSGHQTAAQIDASTGAAVAASARSAQRVGSDVNAAAQSGHQTASQIDASTGAAAAASARPGRIQAGGRAGAQAEVSH